MKRKVIHVLCHTAPYEKEHIYYGWPAVTARNLSKYSSGFRHECFYTVTSIDKEKEWTEDGVKYRLFPAWTLNKALESFLGIVFSPGLMRALKKETRSESTIFHIQGERGLLLPQILNVIKNRPVFMQFHGYRTPGFLLLFEKIFITPWERYYFKYIKHFFVPIRRKIRYLVNSCKVDPKKISHQNIGVDYNIFKPADKIKMRKKLKLPPAKNILLYVGRFDRVKGVKEIIDAHLSIKQKFNTYLVLIGGAKNNEYYDYAKKHADRVIERLDNKGLAPYFNSADAYCMLCPPEKAKTSGMGVAPCEALASGIPILSSNLFEAPESIQPKIGLQVNNLSELKKGLIYIIENRQNYKNIRALTKPYYSWEMIAKNIFKYYEKN